MALKLQMGSICIAINDVVGLKCKDKLDMMEAATKRFSLKGDSKALKLLLMPEFFGADYDEVLRNFRPMAKKDRVSIYEMASDISGKEDCLVIPGTVLEPLSGVPANGNFEPNNGRVSSIAPVYYCGNIVDLFFKKFYSRGEIPCVPQMKGGKDWPISVPDYGTFSSKKLRESSELMRSEITPDLFTISKHDFGLEICNDMGFLATVLGRGRSPGCQIVISQGMSLGYYYDPTKGAYVDRDAKKIESNWAEPPEDETMNEAALGLDGVFLQCDGPTSRCATKGMFGHWQLHKPVDQRILGNLQDRYSGYRGIPSTFVLYPPVSLDQITLRL